MDELKFGDTRLPERFWKRHAVDSQGCWLWNSDKSLCKGRAYIQFKDKVRLNYAVTSDLIRGPLPLGLTRSHICPGGANPLCANPQHIVIESHADNIARSRKYAFEYPVPGADLETYMRDYLAKYYKENKDKLREYSREYSRKWRAKNKAKIREQNRKYYAKNKAKK